MRTRGIATAFALMAASGSAQARTTSVSCEVSDFSMALSLYMRLAADGSGSPGDAGVEGSLEIRHQKVPVDRRRWSLDGKRPVQFWNREGELKIMLVLGPRDDPIQLVIDTRQRRGEDQYVGEFLLLTSEVKLAGRLACQPG
ncbi:MAG: hypothetical protein AB7L90_11765 [Hyphomicrobiaceae bacterium]